MTIKISIKDATAIADALAEVSALDRDNLALRAAIQRLSWLLPDNVSAGAFRSRANGFLDYSRRDYIGELAAKKES